MRKSVLESDCEQYSEKCNQMKGSKKTSVMFKSNREKQAAPQTEASIWARFHKSKNNNKIDVNLLIIWLIYYKLCNKSLAKIFGGTMGGERLKIRNGLLNAE